MGDTREQTIEKIAFGIMAKRRAGDDSDRELAELALALTDSRTEAIVEGMLQEKCVSENPKSGPKYDPRPLAALRTKLKE